MWSVSFAFFTHIEVDDYEVGSDYDDPHVVKHKRE